MRGSEVRDCCCRIGVELNHHPSGIIGEKMRVRRVLPAASNHEAQMLDVPTTHRARVWNVEGEMLEVHNGERRIDAKVVQDREVYRAVTAAIARRSSTNREKASAGF